MAALIRSARRGFCLRGVGRRGLHPSPPSLHGGYEMQEPKSPEEVVRFTVVTREGEERRVQGKGACEASLACSTCHVIVGSETYDKLPVATEEEEDMLDEATCLTSTSRLGCQIILTKEMEEMKITLPAYSRNYYVDGHVPEPH
ncbi:MAG: hypothetical protein SGPRY_003035 [Prymnesium sp.]